MLKITEMRFLVVDDYEKMRHRARSLLKEMGCENTDEAEDGVVALGMLKAQKYDFVVTDINMPNMNGIDLLKAIKTDDSLKHLTVLMVTSKVRREEIVMVLQSGAAGYIIKPLTFDTFEMKLRTIMQKLAAST